MQHHLHLLPQVVPVAVVMVLVPVLLPADQVRDPMKTAILISPLLLLPFTRFCL